MTKNKISILIIDSEQESINSTTRIIKESSLVSKVEIAENNEEAILKIIKNSPDLILLDYPSKGNAEKELIEFVKTRLPETTFVFVSAVKENAAFAIQNGIYKYLLKPVVDKKLVEIIRSVHQSKQNQSHSRINQIIENTPEETRIRLQTKKGYIILNPDELIFCKSAGFYTELYLTNDRVELSGQFLSKFEEMLTQFNFLRVSRSQLINQRFIRKIYRNNNTIVLSCEGKEYEIKAGKAHIRNLSKFATE